MVVPDWVNLLYSLRGSRTQCGTLLENTSAKFFDSRDNGRELIGTISADAYDGASICELPRACRAVNTFIWNMGFPVGCFNHQSGKHWTIGLECAQVLCRARVQMAPSDVGGLSHLWISLHFRSHDSVHLQVSNSILPGPRCLFNTYPVSLGIPPCVSSLLSLS